MDRHLLFFYGTLMAGHGRGSVLMDRPTNVGDIDLATPVGRGTIRGVLRQAAGGAFPALVDGEGVVHGEVWEAPSEAHLRAALSVTDRIEGYAPGRDDNLYDRIVVPLLSATGEAEAGDKVIVYRYNTRGGYGGLGLGPVIPSGDWRDVSPRWDREWAA